MFRIVGVFYSPHFGGFSSTLIINCFQSLIRSFDFMKLFFFQNLYSSSDLFDFIIIFDVSFYVENDDIDILYGRGCGYS